MWTIEKRVGRLVEIQVASPISVAELAPFGQRMAELIRQRDERGPRSPRFISCADLSAANLFAPEVADWFIELMQRDNPVVERSGFLIGNSAMFGLQLERMLKQANSPLRRAFRETAPLVAWLGELLSGAEHAQLLRFLANSPVTAGPRR